MLCAVLSWVIFMFIDLDGHMAEVQITDWDKDDPDYVVWEFTDKGIHALAEKLDLYASSDLNDLFDKAAARRQQENDEDLAAERHYQRQEAC